MHKLQINRSTNSAQTPCTRSERIKCTDRIEWKQGDRHKRLLWLISGFGLKQCSAIDSRQQLVTTQHRIERNEKKSTKTTEKPRLLFHCRWFSCLITVISAEFEVLNPFYFQPNESVKQTIRVGSFKSIGDNRGSWSELLVCQSAYLTRDDFVIFLYNNT